jgi:hypothetical protein
MHSPDVPLFLFKIDLFDPSKDRLRGYGGYGQQPSAKSVE